MKRINLVLAWVWAHNLLDRERCSSRKMREVKRFIDMRERCERTIKGNVKC